MEEWSPKSKRFSISFIWCLIVFMMIIITIQPENSSFISSDAFLGSVILALISGCVAMFIKTNKKIIFVPVSLLVCIILAIMMGS